MRLGQRVVQAENSHIILTGAAALNKVSGSSLFQLTRLGSPVHTGRFTHLVAISHSHRRQMKPVSGFLPFFAKLFTFFNLPG